MLLTDYVSVSVSNLFGFLGFYVPFMYLPSLVGSNPGISGQFYVQFMYLPSLVGSNPGISGRFYVQFMYLLVL